jgi:hypothetical protein
LTELARKSHFEDVVWTVDNPEWIERARSRGTKALITNNPAKMLRQRGAECRVPGTGYSHHDDRAQINLSAISIRALADDLMPEALRLDHYAFDTIVNRP